MKFQISPSALGPTNVLCILIQGNYPLFKIDDGIDLIYTGLRVRSDFIANDVVP